VVLKNKNLLIFSPFFFPENFKINQLVDQLKLNNKVTVVCPIPNYPKGKFYKGFGLFKKRFERNKNLSIVRVAVWPRKNGSKLNIFLNYLSFIVLSIIPTIILSFKKYDLILVNQTSPITIALPAIIIKKIKGTPLIMWVKDLWPESVKDGGNLKSNFIPNILTPLVKYIYKNCDEILVSSRPFIESINLKVKSKKITYVPEWGEKIFTDKRKIKFKNELIENIKNFKIIFAGNIGVAQDFDTLIKAMKIIKNLPITLIVIGDGRDKNRILKKTLEFNLSDKIIFLGSFSLDKMPYFFNHADALLISLKKSTIFSKTVPSKTQSYMSFGKPILTNADGEVSEIVKEAKCGLTCNSGDYQKLAKNMEKLSLKSSEELNVLSMNAKNYSKENFDEKRIMSNIESIFINNIEK